FQQQWNDLKKFFHNQIIVAHNASFDCSVLRFTLDTSKLAYPDLEYHCTYRLAQETLSLPNHKLDEVSRHFKINLKHHNADSEALKTDTFFTRTVSSNLTKTTNQTKI